MVLKLSYVARKSETARNFLTGRPQSVRVGHNTSRSQALVNVSVCCCSIRYFVGVVRLFSFVFNGPGQCCHHVGKHDYCNITSVRMCDLSVQSTHSSKNRVVHVQYAHTVLMTQFASRALYAVPRVRVKSEVYFGL